MANLCAEGTLLQASFKQGIVWIFQAFIWILPVLHDQHKSEMFLDSQ